MKVLVIGGGYSAEREVSLRSSKAVYEAAHISGHDVHHYDWDGSEQWLNQHAKEFELVLPILHGEGGEDGVIQKILEKLDLPYLGSDSRTSVLCSDKYRCLKLLHESGIRIPQGKLVDYEEYLKCDLYTLPHVLKPYDGGSSVDTFIYPDASKKDIKQIEEAFARHKQLLLEEYISGVEITVPILEGKELSVIEIIPPENQTFDYENKYNGKTKELLPPKNVTAAVQEKASLLAKQVHKITGCRHLSRVDMIVKEDDIYVLEINTIPGMTDQSLFPKAATAAGMPFPEFIEYLIKIAAGNK